MIPVKITEYRSSVHVEEGDRAYLPCISQGHPTPTSNWYRTDSTGKSITPKSPQGRKIPVIRGKPQLSMCRLPPSFHSLIKNLPISEKLIL